MLDKDISFNIIDNNGEFHNCYIVAKFSKDNKNYIIRFVSIYNYCFSIFDWKK